MNKQFVFVGMITFLVAQNYIWPVETGHLLSSVFCEHRPDHFHSGIDIKTNQQNGYPLFAVMDGYVWRVRVSPLGYGRVIYFKLADGNYAVYAHMDAFTQTLENRVRNRQKATNNTNVDIYFSSNEFPVQQGMIVGYSGDTGTIHSHLHFEIRDSNQRPLNPLNFIKIKDSVAPMFKKIAVVPLAENVIINGRSEIVVLECFEKQGKYYDLINPIEITGKVGFSILTWDSADNVEHYYHHYSTEFTVGDSLVFSSVYDEFSFTQTREINWERNYSLMVKTQHKFQNLFLAKKKNKLPFHKNGRGSVSLLKGKHPFSINVEDINGNKAVLSGEIIKKSLQDMVKRSKTALKFSETKIFAKIQHIGELVKIDADADEFGILHDSIMTIFKTGSLFRPSRLRDGKIFLLNSYDLWCPADILGTLVHKEKPIILANLDSTFFVEIFSNTFTHDVWMELVSEVDAIRIEPRTIPLRRQAQIRFRLQNNASEKEQQIFYWKDQKATWDMIINCRHKEGFVIADIWSLESFRLGHDSDFPEISSINFSNNGRYPSNFLTKLKFAIPDITSDWVRFDSIVMELDGVKVYPFYNPHHDNLEYKLTEPLKVGLHNLILSVTDFASHTTTKEFQFMIE